MTLTADMMTEGFECESPGKVDSMMSSACFDFFGVNVVNASTLTF